MSVISLIQITALPCLREYYKATYEIILPSRLSTDEINEIRGAYKAILQKSVLRNEMKSFAGLEEVISGLLFCHSVATLVDNKKKKVFVF